MRRHVTPLAALLALACGGATPSPESAAGEEREPETYAVALRLEDGGTDENETPHTRVALVRIAPDGERTVEELHREVGACYHQDVPNALIAASCWWAGTGARYELRREGDAVVAWRAEEDEETGLREAREAGRVEIPEGARLHVLGPGASAD